MSFYLVQEHTRSIYSNAVTRAIRCSSNIRTYLVASVEVGNRLAAFSARKYCQHNPFQAESRMEETWKEFVADFGISFRRENYGEALMLWNLFWDGKTYLTSSHVECGVALVEVGRHGQKRTRGAFCPFRAIISDTPLEVRQ